MDDEAELACEANGVIPSSTTSSSISRLLVLTGNCDEDEIAEVCSGGEDAEENVSEGKTASICSAAVESTFKPETTAVGTTTAESGMDDGAEVAGRIKAVGTLNGIPVKSMDFDNAAAA